MHQVVRIVIVFTQLALCAGSSFGGPSSSKTTFTRIAPWNQTENVVMQDISETTNLMQIPDPRLDSPSILESDAFRESENNYRTLLEQNREAMENERIITDDPFDEQAMIARFFINTLQAQNELMSKLLELLPQGDPNIPIYRQNIETNKQSITHTSKIIANNDAQRRAKAMEIAYKYKVSENMAMSLRKQGQYSLIVLPKLVEKMKEAIQKEADAHGIKLGEDEWNKINTEIEEEKNRRLLLKNQVFQQEYDHANQQLDLAFKTVKAQIDQEAIQASNNPIAMPLPQL